MEFKKIYGASNFDVIKKIKNSVVIGERNGKMMAFYYFNCKIKKSFQ